jgi:hypothetical protein
MMNTYSKFLIPLFVLAAFLLPACSSTAAPVLPEPDRATVFFIYTDG